MSIKNVKQIAEVVCNSGNDLEAIIKSIASSFGTNQATNPITEQKCDNGRMFEITLCDGSVVCMTIAPKQ